VTADPGRTDVLRPLRDDTFNPRAFMDDEPVDFTKGMEGIDTIPSPKTDGKQTAPQADKSSFARQ
jgi:hypothetical protein